jgi:hypothetical protein
MALPSRDAIKPAVLLALKDGQEHSSEEILDSVAGQFGLTEQDLAERAGIRHQTKFEAEVYWVLGDLGEGQRGNALISLMGENVYRITERGLAEQGSGPDGSADRLHAGTERVLAEYADARATQPYGASTAIWGVFLGLKESFNACPPVRRRATVRADWSAGVGNWSRVAWVAFLDSRETRTTQQGVYPVLLFRQDLSGAYLTLAQGVTEPKKAWAL